MKSILLLICVLLSLVYTATADGACGKNAWVKLSPYYNAGNYVTGSFEITSGKSSGDISKDALASGFSECLFDNSKCSVDKDRWNFYCETATAWKSTAWIGTANIEFDCSNKLEHCYNGEWHRA